MLVYNQMRCFELCGWFRWLYGSARAAILIWFVHEDFELPAWLQYSLCYGGYIIFWARIYFGFTSLVIALMRYTFVVHQNAVIQFGIDRAKMLFYYASIVIPIIIGILEACTLPAPGLALTDICIESYGQRHNITYLNLNLTESVASPIYLFVRHYISTKILYYVGCFVRALTIIIMTNVVEGILYWRSFASIKR